MRCPPESWSPTPRDSSARRRLSRSAAVADVRSRRRLVRPRQGHHRLQSASGPLPPRHRLLQRQNRQSPARRPQLRWSAQRPRPRLHHRHQHLPCRRRHSCQRQHRRRCRLGHQRQCQQTSLRPIAAVLLTSLLVSLQNECTRHRLVPRRPLRERVRCRQLPTPTPTTTAASSRRLRLCLSPLDALTAVAAAPVAGVSAPSVPPVPSMPLAAPRQRSRMRLVPAARASLRPPSPPPPPPPPATTTTTMRWNAWGWAAR